MHILEDLYNLGHHYNFLNYFLEHHGYFDNSVLSNDDWVSFSVHDFSDSLQSLLDEAHLRLQDLLLLSDEFFLDL